MAFFNILYYRLDLFSKQQEFVRSNGYKIQPKMLQLNSDMTYVVRGFKNQLDSRIYHCTIKARRNESTYCNNVFKRSKAGLILTICVNSG